MSTNCPQPITVFISFLLNPADMIPAAPAHASSHAEPSEGRVCSRCSCPDALEGAPSSATFGSFGVQSLEAEVSLLLSANETHLNSENAWFVVRYHGCDRR